MPARYDELRDELATFIPAGAPRHRSAAPARVGHRRELLPPRSPARRRRRERGRSSCACSPAAPGSATPVTFRAAGTSLSGQAITDSVLVLLGDGWRALRGRRRRRARSRCSLASSAPPPIAGSRRFGRKIGPDPASIDAAMIGGIAANNASGMCCGTAQNSYHTLAGMRVVLADGTVLDTARCGEPRRLRARKRRSSCESLDALGRATRADAALAARIRHKFRHQEHDRLQPERAGRLRAIRSTSWRT